MKAFLLGVTTGVVALVAPLLSPVVRELAAGLPATGNFFGDIILSAVLLSPIFGLVFLSDGFRRALAERKNISHKTFFLLVSFLVYFAGVMVPYAGATLVLLTAFSFWHGFPL